MDPDNSVNSSDKLIEERKLNASSQPRGAHGQFGKRQVESVQANPYVSPGTTKIEAKVTKPPIPDLVNFRVTNPIVYLKLWWKKVLADEGMDIRVKVRPLTVIVTGVLSVWAILFFIAGGSAEKANQILHNVPVLNSYIPIMSPSPS